jgi:hypothetical protein
MLRRIQTIRLSRLNGESHDCKITCFGIVIQNTANESVKL